MRKTLVVIGGLVIGVIALAALSVVIAGRYHARLMQTCVDELQAAVRSGKIFEAFGRDPRPDGMMRRYSHEERGELIAHVATRAHTAKDAADVAAMSDRAHMSAIFLFSPMVYVLFFDQEDRMREFVCLAS